MGKREDNAREKLKTLRQEYTDLDRRSTARQECLSRAVGTLARILESDEQISAEIAGVKEAVEAAEGVSVGSLEAAIADLRDRFISIEAAKRASVDQQGELNRIRTSLVSVAETLRTVMRALVDEFYPLDKTLTKQARRLKAEFEKELSDCEVKGVSTSFLDYIDDLKAKISQDYGRINKTFLWLLAEIRELEQSLVSEFAGEQAVDEIMAFEKRIADETTRLTETLNLATTVDQIRQAAVRRIENIGRIVSTWRKDQIRKSMAANDKVERLKEQLAVLQTDADELSEQAEKLRTAAMRDGLTGLYNRKALDVKLKSMLEEYHSNGADFALIIFDVDRFKSINDTFGHVAGDRVLMRISECLRQSFREDDFISRYGGDEFVAIIEGSAAQIAQERIDDFKEILSKTRFFSKTKGGVDVTVSAGVTRPQSNDSVAELLGRADRVMYDQKHQNRSG